MDHQLQSLVEYRIAQCTDAGHARLAEYTTSETVFQPNDTVQHSKLVLDQCPVAILNTQGLSPTLCMPALKAIFKTFFKTFIPLLPSSAKTLHCIRTTPITHYPSMISLERRHSEESTAVYIYEAAQLCYKLLPLNAMISQ